MMHRMALLVCLAFAVCSGPSTAQPVFEVMGAHTANPTVLMPIMDVDLSTQFDVVVLLNSEDSPSAAAEFVLTDLLELAPGVFRLGVTGFIPWWCDPVECPDNGEWLLAFQQCVPAGNGIELLRFTYGTFGGPVPPDTVIELRGLLPGDSVPSTFDGSPGIVDCDDNGFAGRMGGHPGGFTETGVVFPDGSLGLNLTLPVVSANAGSWGALKSRY